MNFVQAEAYTRIYPYLTKVVLPQGVFDLVKKQPKTDISMVAASAALVARKTLHPTIVGLMANAALKTHSRGGLFQKDGEFPKSIDPELPMSDDAKRIYKSGPPFLYRFLPFWLASFLQRSFILMLPIMTVLIPVVKGVPWLYTWRIRNKLLRWYSDIKRLERKIRLENKLDYQANKQEVERIETAASKITVPVGLSDHYYDLRREIDLVHQMLIDNKQS